MKKIEVVAGVIENNGEILCMKRAEGKHTYTSFKYEFPGGKIENGETNVEALKRELKEEMEMEVEVSDDDYLMTVDHEYPDFEIVMHAYKCKVKSREFVMNVHVDHKWLTKDKLEQLDWAAADIPIMKKIMGE